MADDDPALSALRSLDRPRPMPPDAERRVRARMGTALDGLERGDDLSLDQDDSLLDQVVLELRSEVARDRWKRSLALAAAAVVVVVGLVVGATQIGNDAETWSASDTPPSPVGVFCGTHLSAYLAAFEDFQGPGLDSGGARLGREEGLFDALVVLSGQLTRLATGPDGSVGLVDDVAAFQSAVDAAQEQLDEPTPVLVSAMGVAHLQLEQLVGRHLSSDPDCAGADLAWRPLG